MKNEYCVYMHIAPNGKKYIGQTCCSPNRRWQNGFGYVNQKYFYRAIKKYGWDNFTHIILKENLSSKEADALEKKYIEQYRTTDKSKGYNLEDGGHGGKHLSDEQKKKIGVANAGKNNGMYGHKYSEEDRQRIASYWKGRKHSVDSIERMKEAQKKRVENGWKALKGKEHPMYGKKHSEISKQKMSESAKRHGYCGNRNREILMYSMEGVCLKKFTSIVDAAHYLNKPNLQQNIGAVCRGKRKTAGGYIWKYAK